MKTKRVKNKRDVRVKYTLSDKQLKKIKADVTAEAVTKTGMLYLAALAEMGWNEDQIVELFETVSRYAQYIDDHIVKINQVQEIIERKTGIVVKWKW